MFEAAVQFIKGNQFQKAEEVLLKIICEQPGDFDANHMLGVVYSELGKTELAEKQFKLTSSIDPNHPPLYQNWGLLLSKQRRFEEAIDKFNIAIRLAPNFPPVYSYRGNALKELARYREAIIDHNRAIDLAPQFFGFYSNRGNTLKEQKEYTAALTDYDRAIQLNPNYADAFNGCGNVFYDLKRYDEAFAAYDKALSIKPDLENAWLGRGKLFCDLRRYAEAFAAYDKALSIKPDLEGIEGSRLNMKMHLCNWEHLDKEIDDLTNSVRAGKANCPPFALLSMNELPDDHRRCAQTWVAAKHPKTPKSVWQDKGTYKHDRIRLGYVSADLHEHATAYLMAELFELHNKNRFSVTAFSLGRDDNSAIRQRLVSSFDRLMDCRTLSDFDVAHAIADSEIDILVDLKGFTQDSRTNIFAYRPAPIQVNFLGYPGTMGAPYIDYIIGDKTLFTFADAAAYSEKLVQLPDSYQPNDRKRQISTRVFTRQEVGLPDSKFVFCCFNNSYKILPQTFGCWMRILECVEGSVLWLLAENQMAIVNLRKEAQTRGIDPARLVFADRRQLPDHLARHSLADLFLDTLPCTAHTTASDALWAGLPVLTQIGSTFAGRVAASLLKAIDLPELITHSPEEYEALAIELALNREKLQRIREKLARNRLTTPLFDTPLYTKHLEDAYEAMYHRYQAGLPPDHIRVGRADRNPERSADQIGAVPKSA
jgi:predicted O-linked N-acetylglucosamine transferase (SPINDLY family)